MAPTERRKHRPAKQREPGWPSSNKPSRKERPSPHWQGRRREQAQGQPHERHRRQRAAARRGLDTNLQQGNFEFGPSQFDLGAITTPPSGNQQTTTARYDQLGMGGSTPELQDLANQAELGAGDDRAGTDRRRDQPGVQPGAANRAKPTSRRNAVLGADRREQAGGSATDRCSGQSGGNSRSLSVSEP